MQTGETTDGSWLRPGHLVELAVGAGLKLGLLAPAAEPVVFAPGLRTSAFLGEYIGLLIADCGMWTGLACVG